jgi:hypothetical protein
VKFRHAIFAAAVASAALTSLSAGAPSASASPSQAQSAVLGGQAATPSVRQPLGRFRIQNVHTRLCLDDSFASGLRTFGCNGTDWQQWDVTQDGLYSYMSNVHTGRCVDYSDTYGLRPFDCNFTVYQAWFGGSSTFGGGQGYLESVSHRGLCLDDSSTQHLRPFACNGQDYQQWTTLKY